MARDRNSSPEARYLYAIVSAGAVDNLKLDVEGIDGADVYPLVIGSLAAIVSDIQKGELRPERKNLAAHSGVLRKVMDQTDLLPVAFGVVPGSERELRDLVAEHESAMGEQLENVAGKVEMGLRGRLQVPDVFQYILEKFPDLRQARDEMYAGGEPSREDKIELGQQFAEYLEGFQGESAAQVVGGLQGVQTRVSEPRNEEEAFNIAVLVPRDQVDAFNHAVEELAPNLDENIELQVTGPWPAYNFVDLRIEAEEEGEEAR